MKIMNKLSLILFSSPAIASMLLMFVSDKPAQAAETETSAKAQKVTKTPETNLPCSRANCTGNRHLASFINIFHKGSGKGNLPKDEFANLETTPEGDLILEFTEEESEAAMKMFNCDCVNSINALRQMRGIARGVEGNIIIPGPTIKPCNQQAPEIGEEQ